MQVERQPVELYHFQSSYVGGYGGLDDCGPQLPETVSSISKMARTVLSSGLFSYLEHPEASCEAIPWHISPLRGIQDLCLPVFAC
jgi:hypothetical protein